MKTLIIYDAEGYIIQEITDSYRVPVGLPKLEVEIPEGKRIKRTDGIGVDVSSLNPDEHFVILEDIPPSEIETMKSELQSTKVALLELAEMMFGGME